MIWPFGKIWQRQGARKRPTDDANGLYVSRPRIETAIAAALAHGDNLVIYGPPRQGKTMLLARQFTGADSIFIECRPSFKRTQIYRVALSSLGYSVLVEKRKRRKASTTVKLGVASVGVEAGADRDVEQLMQSVTVDLKNPSEVAHLISRLKHLPWLVLNNFQFLDSQTKRNLLFDLTFFTERQNIRIAIVGAWSNEDYLEEIEPAVAGKFRYVFVPTWSDSELREAATQWCAHSKAPGLATPHVDEFLTLADGDISLFRSLVEGYIDKGESAPDGTADSNAVLPIQTMVLRRFRRALYTKLEAIFEQRDAYAAYLSVKPTDRFVLNPKFQPIRNASQEDYLRTLINPHTNQFYSGQREVLLDKNGNPQYLEQASGEVIKITTDVVSFLLRQFHSAVKQGSNSVELSRLAREFGEQLFPKPIALDETKIKAIFARFDEVQRQAFIVPHMFAVDAAADAMEIVDRRLALFLQSIGLDDLEEVLDEVRPSRPLAARRRNLVSLPLTRTEEAAYIEQSIPNSSETPTSDRFAEGKLDEVGEVDEFD
jgi:hypothetical protein